MRAGDYLHAAQETGCAGTMCLCKSAPFPWGKGQHKKELRILPEQYCDNIHAWISLNGDLAFSHQQGIYGFKFLKRFFEISSRNLTLFSQF
jgi:hypothetical protein